MARRILIALLGAALAITGVLILRAVTSSPIIDILGFVATIGIPLISFWLSAPAAAGSSDVDSLAAQLRRRVTDQYADDKQANDLNEGRLPVCWSAAAEDLMDSEGRKVRRAILSGDIADVAKQYLQLPHGRWVVLGAGGAGKSCLLLELMQKLLEAPESIDGRVPVLVPLAAWDGSRDVDQFLADFLLDQTSGLKFSWRRSTADRRADLILLVRRHVLPMFDGLDEMPEPRRVEALATLSRHHEKFRFVLTSRPEEYRRAVEARRPVARTAVVELQPLGIPDIVKYLGDAPHGSADAWLTALRTHKQLTRALATPLMVWIAAATFASKPDVLAEGDATADDIKDKLYKALIPSRYTTRGLGGPDAPSWNVDDVMRWMTYLARDVDRRRRTTTSGDTADDLISWWRLADAAEPLVGRVAALTALLTTGLASGIAIGYLFTPETGLFWGVTVGTVMGVNAAHSRLKPTTVEFRFGGRFVIGLSGGLLVGLVAGGAVFVLQHDLSAVWALAGFGLPLGVVYGLTSTVKVEDEVSPEGVLQRERIFVLAYFIAYGLACAIACWILSGPVLALSLGVFAGLSGGLFNGLPWAVVHLLFKSEDVDPSAGAVAWFRFFLAKLLWSSHRPVDLPWRLLTFLEDARRRGILQQSGASYRFRHVGLVDWLVKESERATAVSPGRESPDNAAVAGH
ncbi:NACHT domain-containing protein [Kribbella albertanoniae]|uniref:NACHT domain-containing protein n=1 Tax=Kribbella albertanoniae TaxID=1266829 RepID=A0A4R4Q3K2_9ACTN|nr:NACHT domain-containing protein [Kribbella albertanoniae]TDC29439.1 NACHT domain-containing protein [Kribbella albertanoniae]